MPSHITLQTSYREFGHEFVRQLPILEKAMIDQGLDPSDFIFAKGDAGGPNVPFFNDAEYTVFVKGRSFSVTQPSDLSFLTYFYDLCVPPPAKHDDPHSLAHKLHSAEHRLEALIGRLESWGDKPI